MADKNIQMTQRNTANTGWDNLFPKTLAANVSTAGGSDVEAALADYTKLIPYAVATGTANTYAISTPTISSLIAGMAVSVKINVDSTGTSTLNWNGKGAKPIKKANGTNVTNLKAGGIYTLRYDGVNFILQGEGGSGTAIASHLLSGDTASVDAGDIVGTMANYSSAEVSSVVNGYMYNGKAFLRPPGGYYSGGSLSNVFSSQPDILAENILAGKSIFGVAGGIANFTGLNKEATGYWNNGTTLYFPIKDAGYYSGAGTSGVYYNSPDLLPQNIAKDKSIFGVAGTNTNKKWASGTVNLVAGSQNIVINNLTFTPRFIAIQYTGNAKQRRIVISNCVGFEGNINKIVYEETYAYAASDISIISNGFVYNGAYVSNAGLMTWYAFE